MSAVAERNRDFLLQVEVLAALLTPSENYEFNIITAILAELSIFIIILTLHDIPVECD